MKIPRETADRLITSSMHELWDTFINLEGEYPEFEEDYDLVRFGIDVKFELYELWEDTKKIVRKDKDNLVIINGDIYKLESFRTEKEERRKVMVNAISDNVAEVDITKPR